MPSSATDLLAERYGRRDPSRRRRRVVVALTATLAAAGTGWVAWAGWDRAHQEVTAQLRGYEVTTDTSTEVTVLVDRRTGGPVDCDVFAQASDHSRVGERVLHLPAGEPGSVLVTVTVTTQRRAVNGVLGDCVAAD